jgi:hypothetical protein
MHNGIANLLSLPQLEADGFTVSYHTGGNWIITTPHGEEITFHREEDGMCRGSPYIDMQSKAAVAMIQTVCQRYEGFTKRKVQDAITACKAQAMTGHPTDAQFLEMVRNKTIKIAPSNLNTSSTLAPYSAQALQECAERPSAASQS